jgi:hypothetical protein
MASSSAPSRERTGRGESYQTYPGDFAAGHRMKPNAPAEDIAQTNAVTDKVASPLTVEQKARLFKAFREQDLPGLHLVPKPQTPDEQALAEMD